MFEEHSGGGWKNQPEPPEDISTMLKQVFSDKDLLEELIDLFLQDSRQEIPLLRESAGKGDSTNIIRLAHGLKGELGNLGVSRASDLARQIEDKAKEEVLESIYPLLDALEQEIELLERFFANPEWKNMV